MDVDPRAPICSIVLGWHIPASQPQYTVNSPLGDEAVALAKFIRSIPERAIPYVPVSIVLEHAHGFGLGLVDNDAPLAWNQFPLTGADELAWGLLQGLWPGSWKIEVHGPKAESKIVILSRFTCCPSR